MDQRTRGSRPAKAIRLVIGVLLLVVGAIWVGQGVGWIGGSSMTGEAVWAVIGGACLVAGAVVAAGALRAPRH